MTEHDPTGTTCGCGCGRRIFTGMYAYRVAGRWFAQGCVRLYPVADFPADENRGAVNPGHDA